MAGSVSEEFGEPAIDLVSASVMITGGASSFGQAFVARLLSGVLSGFGVVTAPTEHPWGVSGMFLRRRYKSVMSLFHQMSER